VILAGEAPPAIPEGLDALLPPWAQQLSLVSLLVIAILAFLRGWVVTRPQAEREVAAERRIAEIWERNATQALELNRQLTEGLAPVLEGNEAILRAVQSLQEEQGRMRERRDRYR
jgi:hypothetical protein